MLILISFAILRPIGTYFLSYFISFVFHSRTCTHVDTLQHVGRGIKATPEYKTSKDSLEEIITRMKQEKEVRTKNLTSINQQKEKLMKDVDTFQEEIINKIKGLAKTSKHQIRSKHQEYKKVIESDESALDTVITSATKTLRNLSAYSEARVFTNVKATETAVKDGEALLEDMSDEWIKKELRFSFNQGLKDKIVNLGHIVESVKEYKAELYGRYKVNEGHGNITGVCVLENGAVLVAEYSDARLIRLDENFRTKDEILLSGQPDDLCRVGHTEVAVCLGNTEKIQFVSIVTELVPSHSFEVGKGCCGIAFDGSHGEIYACFTTCLRVYSKAGIVLRTYEKDDSGSMLFTSLGQVALSAMKEQVFLTDKVKGLIVLNRDGKKILSFSDPDLKDARAVCILPGDLVFVAGASSNNILQIDNDGKKEGILAGPSKGLNRPLAMAYDEENSRIIVGCGSNEMFVFTISRK